MHIYDRLYGEMVFPDIIQSLLDCPALLRLRDVRMANNQFAAFPAFANVSRYEHSLGVCYLAHICAKSLSLPEKDHIELMMACLYHDVGTPPFAHAMEEVLQAEYGFDHENNLRCIIEGTNRSYMGALEQIYFDGAIKLKSVCQSKYGRKLGLDVYRIAKIIVGDKSEPLSFLLNGNGMDLDNIDNIVRASTAMGIIDSSDCKLAERLATSFIMLEDGRICHNALFIQDIKRWQQIRDDQYTAIYESIEDFAYQTMIKKALRLLLKDTDSSYKLSADSWKLTDASIVCDYLLKSKYSEKIIKNVLLEKPFRCLGVLYIQGEGVSSYINKHIDDIEKITSHYYSELMGIVNESETIGKGLSSVVVNFYPDKRKRKIRTDALLMGQPVTIDEKEDKIQSGALLGLFTPIMSNKYKTIYIDGKKKRKLASFSIENLNEIIIILKESIFSKYEVAIYEKRKDKRHCEDTSANQLELF